MTTITKTSTEYRTGPYVDLVTGEKKVGQVPYQEAETVTIPENTPVPGVTKPEGNNL